VNTFHSRESSKFNIARVRLGSRLEVPKLARIRRRNVEQEWHRWNRSVGELARIVDMLGEAF
jgi:hypothetical protein